MSTLIQHKKRMLLSDPKCLPLCMQGYVEPRKDGQVSLPIDGDIVRRIMAEHRDILLDAELRRTLSQLAARQQELRDLASLPDYEGDERLYPYQRVGAEWLFRMQKAILGDDQGLGKTVTSLMAAARTGYSRILVVAQRSKAQDWADHVVKWIDRPATVLLGDDRKRQKSLQAWYHDGGCLVVNTKQMAIHGEELDPEVVLIDEAHKLRNRATGGYRAAVQICRGSAHAYLLTASPVINQPADIWTLLNLVDPKRFSSYWGFVSRFCELEVDKYGVTVGSLRETEYETFTKMLQAYVLRRERDLLTGLPVMERRTVYYIMPAQQREVYDDVLETGELNGEPIASKLAEITRLRQLALEPRLCLPDYDGPSKLDVLVEELQNGDGQAVVFTQFAELAKLAERRLEQEGIRCLLLIGGMKDDEMVRVQEAFGKGRADVLVTTHGTGAEGLNLVSARRAVFLDLRWHPEGNKHAEKRIDRIGQKAETVETVAILTVKSIEEHMWEIIGSKEDVTIENLWKRLHAQGDDHADEEA